MAVSENGSWGVKYRPKTVDEIVGNKDTVAKVKALIQKGIDDPASFPATIGIVGPTGTGKTTTARIIAEAVNDGSDVDYEEINCGTHGGVDEMRALVARARYTPKHNLRIFFLDEFHLLSHQAKSACLKLLEEPPPRTRFIWGTDQPGKVLDSLIGRSYVLNMSPPTTDELVAYLTKIIVAEKVKFGSKTLREAVLRSLCIRNDNMPRHTVNALAGIVDTINDRVEQKKAKGEEITKEDLQAIVKQVSMEEEASSPLQYASDILGCIYERATDDMRKLVYSYNGDYVELLRFLASANNAVCRKAAGLNEVNRFVGQVAASRKKFKTTPKAGMSPSAYAKVDPFTLQVKLMELQESARFTTFPVEMVVTPKLATII